MTQPRYKALVIGCGSIGADYDLHSNAVQTHAKAFHLHPAIDFAVADKDEAKAALVAAHYGVPQVRDLTDDALRGFDIVSLCVSTRFHFSYLEQLLALETPLILCEKPVVNSLDEVAALQRLLDRHPKSKILVNYIRRFQPGFAVLRDRLARMLEQETLRQLVVRYTRGLMNNAGHALDTLSFLLGDTDSPLERACFSDVQYDAFPDDPTATLQATWHGVPLSFLGYSGVSYGLFEIDLYTDRSHVAVRDSGNTIRYYHTAEGGRQLVEDPLLVQADVLKDYMLPVVKAAMDCLEGRNETNFASAIRVNEQLLTLIENLPK